MVPSLASAFSGLVRERSETPNTTPITRGLDGDDFYTTANRCRQNIGNQLVTNTYIVDEINVGRRLRTFTNGEYYYTYQYIMRCYVDGEFRIYDNERLFNGVLVAQKRILRPQPPEDGAEPESHSRATTLDVRLSPIQEEPPGQSEWFRDYLEDVAGGVIRQKATATPDNMHRWMSMFAGVMDDGLTVTSPDKDEQASIEASYQALSLENMTLMEGFRHCVKNWRNVRNSPFAGHVMNLIGSAITLGFLDEGWSEFRRETIVLYKLKLEDYRTFDNIIDAVVEALNYFVESAVAAWTVGNLTPFLYAKTMSAKLDEAYECCSQIVGMIDRKEIPAEQINWSVIFHRMSNARHLYGCSLKTATPGSQNRRLLQMRLEQICSWEMKMANLRTGGALVKQAQAWVYQGLPGCGKSVMTDITLKIFCAMIGIEYDPAYIADIVTGDEYDSKITNATMFIRQDDIANRPLKFDPSFGIAKMLQICNNVQFTAVKAELELKGRVNPDIKLAVGTTNNKEMDMSILSVCPNSLRRRVIRVDMVVKEEFATSYGGVDYDTITKDTPSVVVGGVELHAIQLFTINTVYKEGYGVATWKTENGIVHLENLELDEYLKYMELMMEKHLKDQQEHVATSEKRRFHKCGVCNKVSCTCHALDDLPPLETKLHGVSEGEKVKISPAPACPVPYEPEGPTLPLNPNARDPEGRLGCPSENVSTTTTAATIGAGALKSLGLYRTPFGIHKGKAPKPSGMVLQESFISRPFRKLLDTFSQEFDRQCRNLVLRQTGFFQDFFSLPLMLQQHAAKSALTLAFEVIREDIKFQWWYWLPEEWWESSLARAAARIMPPHEIYEKITRTRRRYIYSAGLLAGTIVGAVVADHYGYTPSRACNTFHDYGRWLFGFTPRFTPHFLESYINVTNCGIIGTYITSLREYAPAPRCPKVEFIYPALLGSLGAWFKMGADYAVLSIDSYHFISRQRNSISAEAKAQREKYSPLVKALIWAVGGAVSAFAVGYKLGMFGDGEDSTPKAKAQKKKSEDPCATMEEKFKMFGVEPNRKDVPQEKASDIIKQGAFLGEDDDQLEERSKKIEVWKLASVQNLMGYSNATMTPDQLLRVAPKNLSAVYKVMDDGTEAFMGNITYACTNFAWVPLHFAPKVVEKWKIYDSSKNVVESAKTVSPEMFIQYEGADMTLAFIKSRGKKNLIPYLNPQPDRISSTLIWRCNQTKAVDITLSNLPGEVTRDERKGFNSALIQWQWPRHTFVGACGAVYVSSSGKHPGILGIHIGRSPENPNWAISYCPTPSETEKILCRFQDMGIILPPNEPEGQRLVNGEPAYTPSDTLPKKNLIDATEWLKNAKSVKVVPEGAAYVGHTMSAAFYKSRAIKTIIADEVIKLYDERQYGKPKFGRSMWAKSAVHAFNTTPGFPYRHELWAFCDYMTAYEDISEVLKRYLRPLTHDETINGLDAVSYIDGLRMNTSMGKNRKGTKWDYVIRFFDALTGNEKRDFVESVNVEVREVLALIMSGKRPNWIFNAVPKDEPTPLDKDKVRLFMVAEISCTYLVRKYFLPVCRVIQMQPSISECAVGINCISEDWEDLMRHLENFANYFDGDHSKYDLRKNAKLSMWSYRIMIEIAALGAYSSQDLFVMSMMVEDLVGPLVAYREEVYRLDGCTPSGIPVTVIINSLDNSIINRCAFFNAYPHSKPGDFRRYVKLITYGDDFIAAVSAWRKGYNFLSMQKYMAKYDLVLTPAIKKNEGKRFVNKDDLVFLQRTSTKLPEMSHRVGKLSEASIFKSLLCVLEGELTPERAAATNVDGALREWVFHGRKHFEMRQTQMREIAAKCGISHLCSLLNTPFSSLLSSLTA